MSIVFAPGLYVHEVSTAKIFYSPFNFSTLFFAFYDRCRVITHESVERYKHNGAEYTRRPHKITQQHYESESFVKI